MSDHSWVPLGVIANEGPCRCLFFVQAWKGRTRLFCEALEEAAETVKMLLGAEG